jgi:hypothetical protein
MACYRDIFALLTVTHQLSVLLRMSGAVSFDPQYSFDKKKCSNNLERVCAISDSSCLPQCAMKALAGKNEAVDKVYRTLPRSVTWRRMGQALFLYSEIYLCMLRYVYKTWKFSLANTGHRFYVNSQTSNVRRFPTYVSNPLSGSSRKSIFHPTIHRTL